MWLKKFYPQFPPPSSYKASQYSPLDLRQQNVASAQTKRKNFSTECFRWGKLKAMFRITWENKRKKLMPPLFLTVAESIRTERLRVRCFYRCMLFYVAYSGVCLESLGVGISRLPEFALQTHQHWCKWLIVYVILCFQVVIYVGKILILKILNYSSQKRDIVFVHHLLPLYTLHPPPPGPVQFSCPRISC
jgi:hypothetical protein